MIKEKKGIIGMKSEKGAITVFVLATMLFLVTVLFLSYMGMSNKVINTEKQVNKIQEEYSSKDESEFDEEYEKAANTTKSYVGYYADIDGDGIADGIIYADLLMGNTKDSWGSSSVTIPKVDSEKLREYMVSNEKYNGPFGANYVVTLQRNSNASKENRFYVMSLKDVEGSLDWFSDKDNIEDSAFNTFPEFGKGQTNTEWIMSYYYKADENMLNLISKGWFIPSTEEWIAFGQELNITSANYSSVGLKSNYYTSVSSTRLYAEYIDFTTMKKSSCTFQEVKPFRLSIYF